jgi:sorbitol/mannitol transport system permease protein
MKKPGDILLTLVTYLAVFAMFFPILWTLVAALKTEANAVSLPPTIAFVPTIENFVNAFSNAGYLSFFAHSLIITIGSTAVASCSAFPPRSRSACFRRRARRVRYRGFYRRR